MYNIRMPGIKVSKKTILKVAARIYFIFAVLFVIIADNCTNDPYFVPVMSIDGVPETGTVGIPLTLTGTVHPSFANNNKIVWSLDYAGTTGATLDGNILYVNAEGKVTIRALISNGITEGKDYTQYFIISFIRGGDRYDDYFTSFSDMNEWLKKQPVTNKTKPYRIKLIVDDLTPPPHREYQRCA